MSGQEDEGQEVGGAWRLIGDSLPWFGSSDSAGEMFCLPAFSLDSTRTLMSDWSLRSCGSSESQSEHLPPAVEQRGLQR